MGEVSHSTPSRVKQHEADCSQRNPPAGAFRMALHLRCHTEHIHVAENSHLTSARGGIQEEGGRKVLPRWKRDSVLTFTINKRSFIRRFRSDTELKDVESALDVAVKDWNTKLEGIGVSFESSAEGENALFDVRYSMGCGSSRRPTNNLNGAVLYATAFFPNSESRVLRVFDAALKPRGPENERAEFLSDIFRHELGHILGLRHQDADFAEGHNLSVELSDPNKPSIMTREVIQGATPSIGDSDVEALSNLYALPDGKMVDGFQVTTVDPLMLEPLPPPVPLQQQQQQQQQIAALREESPPREVKFVDAGAGPGVHSHTAIIALCAVAVCAVLLLVMAPRITVTCSSHVHNDREWRNWDGWFHGGV